MTQSNRRLPREQRRAQLLEVAQQVFSRHGYFASSMDLIADSAGVSKPVLYQHFPGKLELYLALLDSELQNLVTALRAALNSSQELPSIIQATIEAYFGFVAREGSAHQMVFESDLSHDPSVERRLKEFRNSIGQEVGEKISRHTPLDTFEAEYLGHVVTTASERAAGLWYRDADSTTRERASELVWRLAWRGIDGFAQGPSHEMP